MVWRSITSQIDQSGVQDEYRRAMEQLSTNDCFLGAFRSIIDGWFYGLEEDVLAEGLIAPADEKALAQRADELMESRLVDITRATPQFAAALRAYRAAQRGNDHATAEGLAGWLAGQPHVAATLKRTAGVKGDVDHYAALSFLRGLLLILKDSGYSGLILVLDEIETLQRVRGDVREKGNSVSKSIINDSMKVGDLVLAYQTNDRNLVGVCRLAKITGERNERILFMKPQHRFDPPVPIHELKEQIPALRSVSAFSGGFPQTVYAVSPKERQILERACAVNLSVDANEPALPPKTKDGGACFGDPETNRKVERAAVRFVSAWYRKEGWKVKSVEAKKCGYDLLCRRMGNVEHVEVKGVTGGDLPLVLCRKTPS